jgi:hypothetical protein
MVNYMFLICCSQLPSLTKLILHKKKLNENKLMKIIIDRSQHSQQITYLNTFIKHLRRR